VAINGESGGPFDIDRAVINGPIPLLLPLSNYKEELRDCVSDYLMEEIASQGTVGGLPEFSDSLRVDIITNAELLAYTNVGGAVGVSAEVVHRYVQILEDALLEFRLARLSKSKHRHMTEDEKFHLFDLGVSDYRARRAPVLGAPEFDKSFEHFILIELLAYRSYRSPEMEIRLQRTSNHLEVDFIVNDNDIALEMKASQRADLVDC